MVIQTKMRVEWAIFLKLPPNKTVSEKYAYSTVLCFAVRTALGANGNCLVVRCAAERNFQYEET